MTIKKSHKRTHMKQLKLISLIFILTNFFACGPSVTFSEPQPVDSENLSKFPDRLQGKYISLADSSTLFIGEKIIHRIYDLDQKTHLSQLDSNYRIIGDTMIDLITNEKEIIKRYGDTLLVHIHFIDTLFQMNYDNVVRKFKGYYFLNKRYDKESWEVKKVELSKGQLIVSSISSTEDIENLKTITESIQDTIAPYKFATTKKQFKKFIKNDGFTDSEKFIRLKKNTP